MALTISPGVSKASSSECAEAHLRRCRMMYFSVEMLVCGSRLSSSLSFCTNVCTSGSVSDPRSTSSGLFTPSPASEPSELRLSFASPIRSLYWRKGMMGSGSWGGDRGREHNTVSNTKCGTDDLRYCFSALFNVKSV